MKEMSQLHQWTTVCPQQTGPTIVWQRRAYCALSRLVLNLSPGRHVPPRLRLAVNRQLQHRSTGLMHSDCCLSSLCRVRRHSPIRDSLRQGLQRSTSRACHSGERVQLPELSSLLRDPRVLGFGGSFRPWRAGPDRANINATLKMYEGAHGRVAGRRRDQDWSVYCDWLIAVFPAQHHRKKLKALLCTLKSRCCLNRERIS